MPDYAMLEKVDIAVVGAGVVGLAVAYELSRQTEYTIVVLDKHTSFGQETSSRNSQVIHSGIYYPANLLKTKLCIEGSQKLYAFCNRYQVGHKRLGKLVVASASSESTRLQELQQQAQANGIQIQPLSTHEVRILEPAIRAQEALWVPDAGIVDVHGLMQRLYSLNLAQGVLFAFHSELRGLEFDGQDYTLTTNRDRFKADWVINSAGLTSDNIPAMLGINIDDYNYRIYPCKGEYYCLNKSFGIRHLVYPLPGSSGLLGIHITPDMSGRLRLGPNAYDVSSFAYDLDSRHHDFFYRSVQGLLPALQPEDIAPDFAGIRPRRQRLTEPLQDFVITEETAKGFPHLIDLIGIESPGLTSCLAIADYVRSLIP
jgi:L-2-hydroxyglutarate oxidase LhgO